MDEKEPTPAPVPTEPTELEKRQLVLLQKYSDALAEMTFRAMSAEAALEQLK